MRQPHEDSNAARLAAHIVNTGAKLRRNRHAVDFDVMDYRDIYEAVKDRLRRDELKFAIAAIQEERTLESLQDELAEVEKRIT